MNLTNLIDISSGRNPHLAPKQDKTVQEEAGVVVAEVTLRVAKRAEIKGSVAVKVVDTGEIETMERGAIVGAPHPLVLRT